MPAARSLPSASATAAWRSRPGSAIAGSRTTGCRALARPARPIGLRRAQGGAGDFACDALGCILSRHGRTVALARAPEAIEEDCRAADLVLSYPRVEWCPGATPLIGPRTLRRAGGLALWLGPAAIEVLTVREARGVRPWAR